MLRRVLLIIPALLVLLPIGVVVVLKSMDFNAYRDQISAEVRKATGRQFSINGDLDLALSLNPSLTVNDVRLGNVPWGTRPDMVKVGRLEAQVALLPLLSGDIQIQRVVLIDTDLMLETQPMGKGNWVFGGEVEAADKEGSSEQQGALLPSVGKIEVRNLSVTFHDGAIGKTTVLHLNSVIARTEAPLAPLQLEMHGSLDKEAFRIFGKVSPFRKMIAGRSLELDLIAQAGGTWLKADGVIAEPATGKGIDLKVVANGADLATLSSLVRVKLPSIKPWKASFSLEGDRFDLRFDDIKLLLDGSDVAGSLLLKQQEGKVPFVEAELHSRLFDLAALQGRKAQGKRAKLKHEKKKIFSSELIAFDALNVLDAAVVFRAERFVTQELEVSNLEGNLRLDSGKLTIKPFKAGVVGGTTQGRLVLNAAARPARLALRLNAKRLDLSRLLKAAGDEGTITGKGDLALNLKGQGNSFAAVMGSLHGYTRLLVGKGTLKAGNMDSIVGGLSKAVGTMAVEETDMASMNCLASDFEIKKGVATSRALMVDTEYSTVFGEGNVDLGQESLDLLLKPKSKSATLNVAVPVRVGGTLANPTFGLEKVAVVRKAAGLLAVVGGLAFPPAALLGLGELGTGEDNLCLQAAQGMDDKVLAQQLEEKKDEGGIKGVLEDVGGKLKGLFGY
jgi:uncharacterized protein involved in outer membrane biogenesis